MHAFMRTFRIIISCLVLVFSSGLCETIAAGIDGVDKILHRFQNEQKSQAVKNTLYYRSVFDSIGDIVEKPGNSENDRHTLMTYLEKNPLFKEVLSQCQETQSVPSCNDAYLYRNHDGTCNNLFHPTWGAKQDCLLRILPARYEGSSGIRKSVSGGPLPEPRNLSLRINIDKDLPSILVSNMFTIFGETIAHDMVLSNPPVGPFLDSFHRCCPPTDADPECLPILIRADDPFYSKRNITCINFYRQRICQSCEIGKRSLANAVTAAIDGSIVYSNTEKEALSLRTNDGTGKLISRNTFFGELLPPGPKSPFCLKSETGKCFLSGDVRVNLHTLLTIFQTIYLREHNRIAGKLKDMNPRWDDEKLYQETRRIFVAKLQAIVFKEYAPYLVGQELMERYELSISRVNRGTTYNPFVRLGIFVETATGAFRIHSMINSLTGFLQLKNLYSNPDPILGGQMDQLLSGLSNTPSQQLDRFFVTDTTDFLYRQPNDDFGLDLVSLDIQRGRDHGLPTYAEMVNYCYKGQVNISSFDDLKQVIFPENVDLLRENYESYEDIDYWTGKSMEYPLEGSVLTPTTACIVAKQLYHLKYGDRFYYEHEYQVPSFTSEQRQTLHDSTLSRMICDNTNIIELQRNVLLLPSFMNPILPCNSHLDVDLFLWKEQ